MILIVPAAVSNEGSVVVGKPIARLYEHSMAVDFQDARCFDAQRSFPIYSLLTTRTSEVALLTPPDTLRL
ncbi:MAG: hypothetical protein ACRERU_06150 [Methylococcales bacterium]